MNYGLYVSASGVLTSMYRQDVLANNLANVNTAGYKPDAVATRQREAARVEDGLAGMPSNRLLERLGAGALLAPNRTSFAQGAMETTGNPLDAAIQGPGFFKVSAGAGSGKDRIRLTRDGRFTTDSQGRLMTIAGGLPVLDDKDTPIVVSPNAGSARIKADGGIEQNGVTVARIGLVEAPNLGALQKVGGNMFRPTATQAAGLRPATGTIQPESIERSGVDPIQAMLGITNASMAVSNNARMIQLHDDLMNRAINTLGRVA
jgi:flagellar basal-body rod protein FlgG